ncbi:hypothetical protein [Flaviaesturariibacter amylovorans]|uniref:RHS repeat protein n=1 Tax=Flaviaesturariibacter amylovorans TaxID=1084520 RepID=A0ABP8HUI3_9BACT
MNLTLSVFLLVLAPAAQAQVWVQEKKYPNHLEAAGLNGPVQVLSEAQYQWMLPRGDSGRPKLSYTKLSRYNEAGNLLSERIIRTDGSTGHLDSFLYDTRGRLQQRIGLEPTRPRSEVSTRYFYDADGNLLREEATMPGNVPLTTTTYTYDAKGRRTGKTRETYVRRESERTVYTYDAQGRKKQEVMISPWETVTRTLRYPAAGRTETHYRYEKAKDPKFRKEVDGFEQLDAAGRVRESRYDPTPGDPHYVFSYQEDARGNWTHQYVADERQPKQRYLLVERRITYAPKSKI